MNTIETPADIKDWVITTIGQRPTDHLVRDNLFGSLIRDPRAFAFQAMTRKPEDYILGHVSHLPEKHQRQAINLVVLQYLHRRRIAQTLEGLQNGRHPSRQAFSKTLRTVLDCVPVGALVKPKTKTKVPLERQICKNAKLCPWCHARQVLRLYEALSSDLLKSPDGRVVASARAAIVWTPENMKLVDAWWQLTRQPEKALGCDLSRQIRYVNEEVKPVLRDLGESLGIRSGILTYHLGPHKFDDGNLGFRHHLGLLGEIPSCSNEDWHKLYDVIQNRLRPGYPNLEVNRQPVFTEWIAAPAHVLSALRGLLAGSSVGYTGKVDTEGAFSEPPRDGIPGVFSLQPTYLFTSEQLLQYATATKGLQAYTPFGAWKKVLGKAARGKP